MITIEVENKKYEMPTEWSEVNLAMLLKINNISSEQNKVRYAVELISVLSGIELKTLYKSNMKDLLQINLDWVAEIDNTKVEKTIWIDDVEYGIVKDLNKLSLGEYVDTEEYSKDMSTFHKVAAVLIRPISKRLKTTYHIEPYDPDTLEERAELFYEKMSVEQILGISHFFLNTVSGS